MTDIANRNRQIKKVVEQAFGKGKVAVRGHRGTAYGWVTVSIGYAPRNWEESRELTSQVMALLRAAKVEIGTYDSADYGCGSEIHINFDRCQQEAA